MKNVILLVVTSMMFMSCSTPEQERESVAVTYARGKMKSPESFKVDSVVVEAFPVSIALVNKMKYLVYDMEDAISEAETKSKFSRLFSKEEIEEVRMEMRKAVNTYWYFSDKRDAIKDTEQDTIVYYRHFIYYRAKNSFNAEIKDVIKVDVKPNNQIMSMDDMEKLVSNFLPDENYDVYQPIKERSK